MWISVAYTVLLLTATSAMLSQLWFKQKRTEHILFAVFCGSLSMVAIQNLTADVVGPYQYLIAMGACATCNAIWLVARALFRGQHSLSLRHYLFAGTIAALILINRSVDLLFSLQWLEPSTSAWVKRALGQVTGLMSSTVLALTFWESVRGYQDATKSRQRQQLLFACTISAAVFSTTVIAKGVLPQSILPSVFPWFVVACALCIIGVTQTILIWQHRERKAASLPKHAIQPNSSDNVTENVSTFDDHELFQRIEQLMQNQKPYLRHELKMVDVANQLAVSEYKISRVIRHLSCASNFNHYINRYRLAHAKQLLVSEDAQRWTILVISMESGFASLAPFNRAFKAQEGCTPNQYRMAHQGQTLARLICD